MGQHKHLISFLCIASLLGGVFVRGVETVGLAYEDSISSQLQANLLAIKAGGDKKIKEIEADRPVEMLFLGDIMLDRGVARQMENNDDYTWPFKLVADRLSVADIVVGNLEGPISNRGENQGSRYSFRFKPRVVEGLQLAGIDGVSLANNHILDYGFAGLADTRTLLNQAGIFSVGAGENSREAEAAEIVSISGNRIAFISATNLYPEGLTAKANRAGVNNLDLDKLSAVIKGLKSGDADIVVVLLHFGEEYKSKANDYQKEVAKVLAGAGADLIIGTHPHVIEEVENINGTTVAYSLGNFVFDQDFSRETSRGIVLRAIVKNKKIDSIETIPININQSYQPHF